MSHSTAPRLRWRIGALLGAGVLVNYFDRIALSVAGPQLQKELALSPAEMGLLFSAFFWSYALLQIPSGLLLDRFGVTRGAAQSILGMQRGHACALVVGHLDRHGAQQPRTMRELAVLYPFAGGALMIQVQQHGAALVMHRIGGGQIGGDGAFSDPALLAGDQDFLCLHVV